MRNALVLSTIYPIYQKELVVTILLGQLPKVTITSNRLCRYPARVPCSSGLLGKDVATVGTVLNYVPKQDLDPKL
jgi:hypothetical protein